MVSKHQIAAVFVPFEKLPDGSMKKRDDLPRFLTSNGVRNYITDNSQMLSKWLLEWREHTERDLIDEYIAGVGTPQFRRQ